VTNTITTTSTSLPRCKPSTLGFIAATFESTADQASKLPQGSLNQGPTNQSALIPQDKKKDKLKRFSKIEFIERNANS